MFEEGRDNVESIEEAEAERVAEALELVSACEVIEVVSIAIDVLECSVFGQQRAQERFRQRHLKAQWREKLASSTH